MSLTNLATHLHQLKARTKHDPFRFFTPTPPQLRFFKDKSPCKILLGGNQIGKTVSLCWYMVALATGRFPQEYHKTDPPPLDLMLITYSHDQRRIIEKKLNDFLNYDELLDTEYVQGKGFRGKVPVVRFKNGSNIYIRTSGMGLALASATLSAVFIDEPVEMDTYNECLARTIRSGKGYGENGKRGIVVYSCTPVGGVDVSYISEMISAGTLSPHYARLSVEDTTPIGCRPLLQEADIKRLTDSFLPIDREARISGSLEGVAPENIIFKCFNDNMISSLSIPNSYGRNLRFSMGIDHGSTPNSQVAILAAISLDDGAQNPKIWILDEYVSGGAPAELHAESILNMIGRHQIQPAMIEWVGDGEHRGNKRGVHKMNNILLMRAFENLLNLGYKQLPFTIRQVVKYRHSVYFGASILHSVMSRGDFRIHPRCKSTIESIKNWTMDRTQAQRSRNRFGHAIDACRYAICNICDPRRSRTPSKIPIGRL